MTYVVVVKGPPPPDLIRKISAAHAEAVKSSKLRPMGEKKQNQPPDSRLGL